MSDRLHTFNGVSFGGIAMAQHFVDLYVWEAVLNDNKQLKMIVELGSWKGGFSLYLEAQAKARRMDFHCFDTINPEVHISGFQRVDIFRDRDLIVDWMRRQGRPVMLFCDNGNKPRELKEFTQHLPAGSVVAVHDWLTEVQQSDVPSWLEPCFEDFCDELRSMTRFFTPRLVPEGA